MRVQKDARKAFEDDPWSKMSASERDRLPNKRADLIERNNEELESQAREQRNQLGEIPDGGMTVVGVAGHPNA